MLEIYSQVRQKTDHPTLFSGINIFGKLLNNKIANKIIKKFSLF